MATDLMLPSGLAPSNLHLRDTVRTTYITHDLYDICSRMKELDQRLYAVQLAEGDDCAFAIMEHCDDGIERLIFRVRELDGRVIERLRHLMAVPPHERMAKIEVQERRDAEQARADELDEMYERMGGEMRHDLARCGFTGPLPSSYRPLNPTARRHGRRA